MVTSPPTLSPSQESPPDDRSVDPEQLLTLLGDEYTRAIIDALGTESLPAREIASRTDISRPTVYRRLDRLETAGVVEPTMTVDPDGHHRQAFEVVIDGLELSLGDTAAQPATATTDTASPASPITLSVLSDSP
ncbi:ArsR/SmtB family transcription factor [Halonotius sp. GCM10025705]|uniref:ArsR/SmtB family transcription factor n=1 Tax=Halonotius sp. GCM10025705 TaxID=3252678 RepID=UPI00360B07B3